MGPMGILRIGLHGWYTLLIHRQRWRVIKLNNTVIGICVGKTTRGMPLKTNEISMATMTLALFDGVEMKYWLDWIFLIKSRVQILD